MQFDELTELIARKEGKKMSIDIAQIKEITKITLTIVASMKINEAEDLLANYFDEQTHHEIYENRVN